MARVHRPEIRKKYMFRVAAALGRIIYDSVLMHGQIDQLPRRTAAQISDTSGTLVSNLLRNGSRT